MPGAVEIVFNNQTSTSSPGLDGPYPTIPITYNNSASVLDCHLTFWNRSLFVTSQTCCDDFGETSTPLLCSDLRLLPFFYNDLGQNLTSQHVNFTQVRDETLDTRGGPQGPNGWPTYSVIMDLQGGAYDTNIDVTLKRGMTPASFSGLPVYVTGNATTTPSNVSTTFPVLDSVLSMFDLCQNLIDTGRIASKTFGLHLGSIEPWVPPSLYLGGFDQNRVLGNLSVIDYDWLQISSISIGVENGTLPLASWLTTNEDFFEGPYSFNVLEAKYGYSEADPRITFDPGVPDIYLSYDTCAALAYYLDLTYDTTRNIYLWGNRSADDPLFTSPAYLEFGLALFTDGPPGNPTLASIKIPFALLQKTFNVYSLDPSTHEKIPPARYFPIVPIDNIDGGNSLRLPTFGRSFLQAAFLGAIFPNASSVAPSQWLIGQAPGPGGIKDADVVTLAQGEAVPISNATLQPGQWTETWEAVLPIWTVHLNNTLYSLPPPSTKIEIGLGVGIGVPLLLLYLIYMLRSIFKSRQQSREMRKEIEEEEEVAWRRETAELQRLREQKIASATMLNPPQTNDGDWDEASEPHESHQLLTNMHTAATTSATETQNTTRTKQTFRVPRKSLPRPPVDVDYGENDILLRDFTIPHVAQFD